MTVPETGLGATSLHETPLEGMHVLILEDEALIAMDVEQQCRDCGAALVTIIPNLDRLGADPFAGAPFHAAILDVMLAGRTTLDFAHELLARKIPFVFASGYVDMEELLEGFAQVEVVAKPYSGAMLIAALASAIERRRDACPSGGV